MGFPVADLGSTVVTGTNVDYAYCPPGSDAQNNNTSNGPLKRAFYGAGTEQDPGSWLHDLELGYVVIAYSCAPLAGPTPVATPTPAQGCPSAAEMAAMQQAFNTAPQADTAKTCGDGNKLLVLRFDSMTTRFAYIAWDRVELTNTFSIQGATTFMEQWQDQANPVPSTCI
ncbi:MAG TPA: hypothetical protein VN771_03040 [Candidatus Baltobacteraceae bacterium]|nr:hypothetical protein [Candidatus Baltobacteraceae bacterium]